MTARSAHRPSRGRRKAWTRDGLAHIEIRGARQGLVTAEHGRLIEKTVGALHGVDWAAWNAALGRLLVSYDEDGLDLGDLIDAVADVESDLIPGTGADNLDAETRHRLTLVADLLGAAGSAVARRLRLPVAARELVALVALVDHLPGVRHRLQRLLGRHEADLLISAVNATINAAGQAELSLLADAALRVLLLREDSAQRETWRRRGSELAPDAAAGRADRPGDGRAGEPPMARSSGTPAGSARSRCWPPPQRRRCPQGFAGRPGCSWPGRRSPRTPGGRRSPAVSAGCSRAATCSCATVRRCAGWTGSTPSSSTQPC
ncbi:hypothetical protein [Dactylosporangium sp. CA-233914]|uniref:hypothetical protein n=1 Tax=Dactylosporangium sp. CA-233914 TaxID=3239934 RepID=UPI003D8FECFD